MRSICPIWIMEIMLPNKFAPARRVRVYVTQPWPMARAPRKRDTLSRWSPQNNCKPADRRQKLAEIRVDPIGIIGAPLSFMQITRLLLFVMTQISAETRESHLRFRDMDIYSDFLLGRKKLSLLVCWPLAGFSRVHVHCDNLRDGVTD